MPPSSPQETSLSRGSRPLACAVTLALATSLACGSVDVGEAPSDVNACRPSQAFFVAEIWPNFLAKDHGGRRCADARCHDAGSGRQMTLPMPTSPPAVPLPPDWEVVYRAVAEQVFCTNVAGSPLIARPDGRQTHGGGKLIDPDGPEAALVKRWVETR